MWMVVSADKIEWTPELHMAICHQRRLKREFSENKDTKRRWAIIKELYAKFQSGEPHCDVFNPSVLDWAVYFSPIEYDAWCSIKSKGLPFLPQYPIHNHFIDFAIPKLKVGLEMDGKNWHNAEKDAKRDRKLAAEGWRIFRIPGSECYTKTPMIWEVEQDEYLDETERAQLIHEYFDKTSDGVIEAIDILYYRQDSEYIGEAARTLMKHRLAEFLI